jgi:pre-rRNA-processing protein IPI3
MEEHLFYTSSSTVNQLSTGSGTGIADFVITQVDLHSGAPISSFKQSSSSVNGLQVTDGHIFASQSEKTLLHIYAHNKEGVEQKIVLPEKLSCIKVSPKGNWLAGGGHTGRLLVWEIKSGNLLFARDTHYQKITCIEFTQDESHIVTASSDSRVHVWNLVDLVDLISDMSEVRPVVTWSDHTLEVTGLYVGYGKSCDCRIFTASADSTVRSYDLRTKSLLTTYSLPEPISALTVDSLERVIYAGSISGTIHMVSLYEVNSYSGHLEALGGAQRIISVSANSDTSLRQHETSVTCMRLSMDSNVLVSGDASGNILSWDVLTKQVLRKFRPHKGAITGISVKSNLKQLSDSKKQVPHIPVLKRIVERQLAVQHDVYMQIHHIEDTSSANFLDSNKDLDLLRMQSAQLLGDSNDSLQLRVNKLEGELETMHKNYLTLKSVHEDLWKVHVARAN